MGSVLDGGLDPLLGDPLNPANPFGYDCLASLDEQEAFPAGQCAALDDAGFAALYVPAEHGGELRHFTTAVADIRALAGRDLTVAIAHAKTFLGAVCVWVAGQPDQARALGAAIRAGAVVSWGLTERGHGSDLLSGEVTAAETAGGFRVDGAKWLVNNATRADLVCTLARTDPAGGPRGFSLLLIDKRALSEGSYTALPKILTHGIRGADISGVSFHGAHVPAGALVGARGEGIDIVLRALQVTRTACLALSLGAADHALDLASGFAGERQLFGRTLIELPYVRRQLGEAYAMLFASEAVTIMAARSAHVLPDQLSVVSAAAKAFVPTTVDTVIARCGEVLGARAFLTREYLAGMFQKVERDHRIVPIFDGSTHVNQHAVITQFAILGRTYLAARASGTARCDTVAASAGLHHTVPELDFSQLTLISRDGCAVVQSLAGGLAALAELSAAGHVPAAVVDDVTVLVRDADRLHGELAQHRPRRAGSPAAAFAQAERYEVAFAAAAAVRFWLHNREHADQSSPLWAGACWLAATVRYLRGRLGGERLTGTAFEDVAEAATRQRRAGSRVSLLSDLRAGARTAA